MFVQLLYYSCEDSSHAIIAITNVIIYTSDAVHPLLQFSIQPNDSF